VRRPHKWWPLPCNGIREPDAVGRPTERDVLARWRRLVGRRGLGHGFGLRGREDGPDELVTAPADRSDVALRFAVVAERAPGRLDATGQCRLTDEASAPHGVEQFLLGHEPVMVA